MKCLKSDDPNYVGDDEWIPVMDKKKKKKKKTLTKKKDSWCRGRGRGTMVMLRCEGCCRKFTTKSNRGRHFLRLTRQYAVKGLLCDSDYDVSGLDEQTLRDAMAEDGSMECLHYAKSVGNTHGIGKKKLVRCSPSASRDYAKVFRKISLIMHKNVIDHLRCCPEASDDDLVYFFDGNSLAMRHAIGHTMRHAIGHAMGHAMRHAIGHAMRHAIPSNEEVVASAAAAELAVREVTEAGGCKCKGTWLCYST